MSLNSQSRMQTLPEKLSIYVYKKIPAARVRSNPSKLAGSHICLISVLMVNTVDLSFFAVKFYMLLMDQTDI